MRSTASAALLFALVQTLSAADPALVNLVMPDAKVMAGINVTRAKTSALGQFFLTSIPEDAGFQQFIQMSGFDPRQDLQEILVAGTTQPKSSLVVARGTFNVSKLAGLATADGKHTSTVYNGAQLIAPTDPKADQAVGFLLDTTPATVALAGNTAAVKAAIDRRKSANSIDPALAAKIAGFSATDAWSVSTVPFSALSAGVGTTPPANANPIFNGDLLKKVLASSGAITLSASTVQISGEALADNPQDAISLGDVVKFLATMMQTGPNGQTLAQNLTVATDGATLKVGLTIPESSLEAFFKAAQGQTKRGAARI